MRTCVIFCAGGFDRLARPVDQKDIVIAADGGLRHVQSLGITPQIVLGDFDSLGYIPAGSEIYPVEKDDTDAMLAVKKGLALGCDVFYIYGALDGPRLDHTVANLQLLQYLAQHGATGYLIGRQYIVRSLHSEVLQLPVHFEGILSVFCMGEDAAGVTILGTKYEIVGEVLSAGFPLGVSNRFVGAPATVTVRDGVLILMWDRKNGLPEEPLC